MKQRKVKDRNLMRFAAAGLVLGAFLAESAVAQGTLFVEGGEVGVGIADPTSLVHVFSDEGTATLLVEETAAVTEPRSMFELVNNGDVGFNMIDSSQTESWRFAAKPNDFRISNTGVAGFQMKLEPSGDMTIKGTLTESSDVNAKRDIEALDGEQVLAKLAELPISEWTYKADEAGARHVGPMAQDFYSTFELGKNDTTISARDMAGVSLAAIKALQAEIAELRQEKAALNERLNAIETSVGAGSVGQID